MVLSIHKKLQGGESLLKWANNFDKGSPDSDTMLEYSTMIVKLGGGGYRVPIPCTAFSQSLSVNSLRWRIRGERAGNIFTFSLGPRDPKRFNSKGETALLILNLIAKQFMASRDILSNNFEEQWTQNYPQYLSG